MKCVNAEMASHPPSDSSESRDTTSGGPMLSLGELQPLVAIIASEGLSPERVLALASLPEGLFDGADGERARISVAAYFRICEQIALQGEDESCHVSRRPLMVGTSEFVLARLAQQGTLGDVLGAVAEAWNFIHGGRYNIVQHRDGHLSYIIDDTSFPYALGQNDAFVMLSIECLMVCVHVLMQSLAGGPALALRGIRTRARGPTSGSSHLSFWNVGIRYGSQAYGLDYDPAVADLPIKPAARRLFAGRTLYGAVALGLDGIVRPTDAPAGFAARVYREVSAGRHDQAEIAAAMGLSVASLRRRLVEAGDSFRAIRIRALCDVAQRRLSNGDAVAEIAEALAFSDGRSFARAFRQWTGVSPAHFRSERARANPGLSEIVPEI